MKTFEQIKLSFPTLPSWLNEDVYKQMVAILQQDGKLFAVKFLREMSNSIDGSLELKHCKDIADAVELEPSFRITITEFKRILRESFMKGVDYELERSIDMHTTSIGHVNPYGNIDSTEAYDQFENSQEITNLLKRFY